MSSENPPPDGDPQAPQYGSPQPPQYGSPAPQPPQYGSQPPQFGSQPPGPAPDDQPPPYGAPPPPPPPPYGSAPGAPGAGAPGGYGTPPPPPYGGPPPGFPGAAGPNNQKVIFAFISSILGILTCWCCFGILAFAGGGLAVYLAQQAEREGVPNANTAKILGYVALGLGVVGLVLNLFTGVMRFNRF